MRADQFKMHSPCSWITIGQEALKVIHDITVDIYKHRRCSERRPPIQVLHLIETGGPGGAERIMLDLARCMGPEFYSTVGLLKPGWLQSQVVSLGIPYVMVKEDGQHDLAVISRLLRVVRERQIQLIHGHEFYMNVMGAAVSRLTGIPMVATVHGKGYYPENRRRRALYRMVAGRAAVIAVSKDLQRFFCETTKAAASQVRVIYNGIDPRPFAEVKHNPELLDSLGIPSTAKMIGTVGNLYPVKGHVHLIRAAQIIFEHRPDVHVIILGRGRLKDALSKEAITLGMQNRIHLLGYRDDVSRWLATMDVFVLPSLSEGLPLSLLEAMATGIPTVVTDVGGMPEVVRDGQTGFVIPAGDPKSLASTILCLLDNPAIATNLGAAGRNLVRKRFSLERMVAEYRDLYQKALASTSTDDML